MWVLLLFSAAEALADRDPPFELPPQGELNKLQSAVVSTNKGNIYLKLFPEEAPWHVANFKFLADKGLYKNVPFHIYYPDYIIQGGDIAAVRRGIGTYSLPAEFNQFAHEPGTLGMARKPDVINPERRSDWSQFHILLMEDPRMNGKYTIFGKVTKGMEVVRSLRKGDVIKGVKVFVREDGGDEN